MRKKLVLEPLSLLLLKIGLAFISVFYYFVVLHIYENRELGIMTPEYAASMLEHVTMTLVIIVSACLMLDIHIKRKKE